MKIAERDLPHPKRRNFSTRRETKRHNNNKKNRTQMAAIKQNKELLSHISDYRLFLNATKTTCDKIVVCHSKPNHPTSIAADYGISFTGFFDDAILCFEIKNADKRNYTLKVQSNKIKEKILFRYDSLTNGAFHRNNLKTIPLEEQRVAHPHFHAYNDEGYLLAYQTPQLKDLENGAIYFDIQNGFPYFCNELHLIGETTNSTPNLKVYKEGVLDIDIAYDDPNEDVDFR